MFDFGKIGETLSEIMGGRDLGSALQPGGLLETLQNSGIDIGTLQGVSAPELLDLLQQHGIDATQLPVAEVESLLQNLGYEGGLADLTSHLANRDSVGGGEGPG